MNSSLDRLARDIGKEIEYELDRVGVFYRIFARAKSQESIEKKLLFKKYESSFENKLMQDIIGIRITLYFNDDIPLVYQTLKLKLNFLSETIDEEEATIFKPIRTNLIFRLDDKKIEEVKEMFVLKYKYIDTTYEIQLRTVLSEGWHEVDHDLRYKCQDDWSKSSDIARTFNGVYASLVTNDWAIMTVFEQLAYRHYKDQNWSAMIRNKFRLRFKNDKLDSKLIIILNQNLELSKTIYKIDRSDFLKKLFIDGVRIPLTLSNLIYVLNIYYLKNEDIKNITPEFLLSNKTLF